MARKRYIRFITPTKMPRLVNVKMNRDMLITLRLLKSGTQFDLKVTRYTNANQ